MYIKKITHYIYKENNTHKKITHYVYNENTHMYIMYHVYIRK